MLILTEIQNVAVSMTGSDKSTVCHKLKTNTPLSCWYYILQIICREKFFDSLLSQALFYFYIYQCLHC